MIEFLFWMFFAAVVYSYVGYPAILWVVAAWFPRPVRKSPYVGDVTVLVVARNEEKYIGKKLDNLLELEYPAGKKEIIVASDASSDSTDSIVKSFGERGVRLVRFEEKMGKSFVLNKVVPILKDEIVVLSDARQIWNSGALTSLLQNFGDPEVGAVSGELVFRNDGSTSLAKGIGFYWRYEKFLRKHEATIHSTCGVTGCIYAMRRALFTGIPTDTLLDDFAIPMAIVRQGSRVVFEDGAVAYDHPSETPEQEKARKMRTLAGNYQSFFRMPWMFNPFANRIWAQFISHKFLRIIVPFFILGMLFLNLTLLGNPLYQAVFIVQLFLYGVAGLSLLIETRLLAVVKTFTLLNAYALGAFFVYVTGRQKVTWKL